jgi:hypothetical protein
MYPLSRYQLQAISDVSHNAVITYFLQKIYNDVVAVAVRGERTYSCPIHLDNSMMEQEVGHVPEYCVGELLVQLRALFPGCTVYNTGATLIIIWL